MAEGLLVTEIFHSIQGESTWAGCPCVFIRLRGCHLRCHYCDTEYAFHEGQRLSLDEVVRRAEAYPCRLAEITGGEPLLQAGVHPLVARLCDRGWQVLIETSGACDIGPCDPRSICIMDIKTPGSGEAGRNDWSNLARLRPQDEVKFVIVDRADYEWARDLIRREDLPRRCRAVLLSPVFDQQPGAEIEGAAGLEPRLLAQWILDDGLWARMQLQMHKMIWEPQTRGV